VTSLLYSIDDSGRVRLSDAEARDYYVQFDENDACWVLFGDGTYGRRPTPGTNNIRATYRLGGGAVGNVPAASITTYNKNAPGVPQIPLLDSVTNPLAAAGGADHESLAHATSFGPLAFRSGQRAVTLSDYVSLAQQAAGVAKVRAASPNWNTVELYVAPVGDSLRPVPEELRRRLVSYFEDRRMAGTFVEILSASGAPIEIGIEIVYDKRYRHDAVKQSATEAVQNLLAFANVEFGQPLYLSDIYGRVEVIPGVTAMTVTRFRRSDAPGPTIAQQAGLTSQFDIEVAADGRIDIQAFEIPFLASLDIEDAG
jgi:predicted phage baseplate assembly protein